MVKDNQMDLQIGILRQFLRDQRNAHFGTSERADAGWIEEWIAVKAQDADLELPGSRIRPA
jgi:hypothetical protein